MEIQRKSSEKENLRGEIWQAKSKGVRRGRVEEKERVERAGERNEDMERGKERERERERERRSSRERERRTEFE